MGTTSEKLTYLNTTKNLIKEELNLGGANITNEPFRAYKGKLEGIYKDFLANGTDTLWNNWEKVSGSGETITLNNTIEAKMDFVYKGNTQQNGTPTPDNPIPVQVVSGDNTIKVEGKNLFDDSVERKSAFTTGDVGQQVGYGSSSVTYSYVNCAYLQANTTYTISWNKNTPANTSARDSVIVDENNIILEKPQIWTNNRETYTFTPTHNGYLIFVYDINTTNIQLELGSTATTYEPYQTPQTYPINIGSIELCKIGDYQDRIYKDNGKWYLNKQIGKVVLDGSEDWTKGSQTNVSVFVLSNVIYPQVYGENGVGLSNRFKYEYVNNANAFYFGWSNNVVIVMPNTYTLESFKTWLSSNNTSVYYITTPTYEEITDTTLISQLEALKKSYNTQTNISQTNNDMPFILDVVALGE